MPLARTCAKGCLALVFSACSAGSNVPQGSVDGLAAGSESRGAASQEVASLCAHMTSDACASGSCEALVVAGCNPLGTVLAPSFVRAASQCMQETGVSSSCFVDALDAVDVTSLAQRFVAAYCNACGGDRACDATLLERQPGHFARALADDVLKQVGQRCLGTCGDAFDTCATQALATWIDAPVAMCFYAALTGEVDPCALPPEQPRPTPKTPAQPEGPSMDPPSVPQPCSGQACCDENPEACVCTPTPDEPNDTQDTARNLGDITDDDDDALSVSGTLGGGDSIDWYTFHGEDAWFNSTRPTAQVTGGFEVCVYATCDTGEVGTWLGGGEHPCPDGFRREGELYGCCAIDEVSFPLYCTSGITDDDSAQVYVSVASNQPVCRDYTLTTHF